MIFYVSDVVFIVFQFTWFSACADNVLILVITVIASLFFSIIVCFRTRDDASILTSAIVILYLLYLSWSGMSSRDGICGLERSADNGILQIVTGLAFTILSLLAISASTKQESYQSVSEEKTNVTKKMATPMMEDADDTPQVEIEGKDG